jgi:hypothetical protein
LWLSTAVGTIAVKPMPEGIPPYILVVRIGTILGMAFSIAIGLLLLIGGFWLPSLIAFAVFVPSIATMVYAEKRAAATNRPAPR